MEDSALHEIAELIIQSLRLEDLTADEIDPDAALFGEGLGLDSIDALELALAISQRCGVTLSSDDPKIREIFSSLRSLTEHIQSHRKA